MLIEFLENVGVIEALPRASRIARIEHAFNAIFLFILELLAQCVVFLVLDEIIKSALKRVGEIPIFQRVVLQDIFFANRERGRFRIIGPTKGD